MSQGFNQVLSGLSHPARRFVVFDLWENGGVADLSDLSRAAAEIETLENDPEDLKAALRHRHIPTLEKSNLIEWDNQTEVVELTIADEETEGLVDHMVGFDGW